MLCEECNQNPATVTVLMVMGGKRVERHLCAECMSRKGAAVIGDHLGGLLASVLEKLRPDSGEGKTCAFCGESYEEFKRTGRLGCARCYEAFAEELEPVLNKIHGTARHTGSRPEKEPDESRYVLAETIEQLQKKMADAVAGERFEEAAKYRDQIRALTHTGEAEA